ncbi:MAG: sigma-54 dependent transcriptional regulator [Polyangiaceae bacterium]
MSGEEQQRILVVDDSEATRTVLRRNLEAAGYHVQSAASVREALEVLRHDHVDLVVTDVKMPRVSGLDLVREVRDNFKNTEVMVITGYPNVGGAVASLKNGATDYLTKPFTDAELMTAVRHAIAKLALHRAPQDAPPPPAGWHGLLGDSAAMLSLREQIRRASRGSATVLITGESGTGKELVARAIHYGSERSAAPFVTVNCGAIPQDLLESELFGHVKGAFTGATESRAGYFITADGGTIFLDEIAETSQAMQVKLLRVLQDKQVSMLGSTRPRGVDVRVIAATNKNLEQLVHSGSFREDLYFRINVLSFVVPPLRERGSDIEVLMRHFVRKFSAEYGRSALTLSDRVLEIFQRYPWPGNVRELENAIQRLVVMTEGDSVEAADLPATMRFTTGPEAEDLTRTLAQVESDYVRRVLASVGGNKSRAARILDVDRKTLRTKAEAGEGDDD